METKEAILATISEFGNDLKAAESAQSAESKGDFAGDSRASSDSRDSNGGDSSDSANIFIDIKDIRDEPNVSDEAALLLKLKEKSLVLFEGLKGAQGEAAEMKLEMVIGYLEYQLYLIEERLKNIER